MQPSGVGPVSAIELFTTSTASSIKTKKDCQRLRALLVAKKIPFVEIDLAMQLWRRVGMLETSDGIDILPQLHAYGKFIGDLAEVQELEDFGELDDALKPPPRTSADQPLSLDQLAAVEAVPCLVPESGIQASRAQLQVEDLQQGAPGPSRNHGLEAQSTVRANSDNSASPMHDTAHQNGKPEESSNAISTAQSRQRSSEAMPFSPSECVGLAEASALDRDFTEGQSSADERPLHADKGAGLEETHSQGIGRELSTHESSDVGTTGSLDGSQPPSRRASRDGQVKLSVAGMLHQRQRSGMEGRLSSRGSLSGMYRGADREAEAATERAGEPLSRSSSGSSRRSSFLGRRKSHERGVEQPVDRRRSDEASSNADVLLRGEVPARAASDASAVDLYSELALLRQDKLTQLRGKPDPETVSESDESEAVNELVREIGALQMESKQPSERDQGMHSMAGTRMKEPPTKEAAYWDWAFSADQTEED